MAILSCKDKDTRALFEGRASKKFQNPLRRVIERKLAMVDAARALADLASPPGNNLEPLRGERAGQHSIRVNAQFRICFRWTEHGPHDVEVTDYH